MKFEPEYIDEELEPPAPVEPSPTFRERYKVIMIILPIIVVIGLGLIVLFRPSRQPEIVTSYLEALNNHDSAKVESYLCDNFHPILPYSLAEMSEGVPTQVGAKIRFEDAVCHQSGDNIVKCTLSQYIELSGSGASAQRHVTFYFEDDKICNVMPY